MKNAIDATIMDFVKYIGVQNVSARVGKGYQG